MSNTINTVSYTTNILNDRKSSVDSSVKQKNNDTQPERETAKLADSVTITDTAKKLANAETLNIDAMPVYNNNKIDAIKEQIANGTYDIDSKAIADKLLEFEKS